MKVLVVSCYKLTNYGRAVNLGTGLQNNPQVETIIVKNSRRGIGRYPEVFFKLIKARRQHHPDAYLLTFRGYELLPLVLLIAWGKPVVFDELINPLEVVSEHRRQRQGTLTGWLMGGWLKLGGFYRWLAKQCRVILADTAVHAEYSAQLNHLDKAHYLVVPVGANEKIFKPTKPAQPANNPRFEVLYYGSMVPLHGFKYVMEAIELLKGQDISWRLAGGGAAVAKQVAEAKKHGADVSHQAWLDAKSLPAIIAQASLCIGGPFGNTTQSQLVVTGKTFDLLASATPTLVGQSPAITEAGFKDRVNCLVVPQANAQAIADAVLWAKNHPAKLTKIGQAGRQLYEQKLGQAVINRAMSVVLAACL